MVVISRAIQEIAMIYTDITGRTRLGLPRFDLYLKGSRGRGQLADAGRWMFDDGKIEHSFSHIPQDRFVLQVEKKTKNKTQ